MLQKDLWKKKEKKWDSADWAMEGKPEGEGGEPKPEETKS